MMSAPSPHASLSDVGRLRRNNEDACGSFVDPAGTLLIVVCDGVGGHEGGEVASRTAVEAMGRLFQKGSDAPPLDRLSTLVVAANEAVLAEGRRIGLPEMGTTLVALMVQGDEAWAVNVGDSRAYLFRSGRHAFRTNDHTRVRLLVDAGLLSEGEAPFHRDAHMITRALGRHTIHDGTPLRGETYGPLALEPGDAVVLNTDGLHDMLDDDEILGAISGRPPADAVRELVRRANARGGADNITVSVYAHRVACVPGEPQPERSDSQSEIIVAPELHPTFSVAPQATLRRRLSPWTAAGLLTLVAIAFLSFRCRP